MYIRRLTASTNLEASQREITESDIRTFRPKVETAAVRLGVGVICHVSTYLCRAEKDSDSWLFVSRTFAPDASVLYVFRIQIGIERSMRRFVRFGHWAILRARWSPAVKEQLWKGWTGAHILLSCSFSRRIISAEVHSALHRMSIVQISTAETGRDKMYGCCI